MKRIILSLLFFILLPASLWAQADYILGGELGNSSASSRQDIERIFPRLQQMGLNTVLVPAYWDLTEPVEGRYDFTLTDHVLEQACRCNLKVVFLWFGAWKNSMSCYAPLWLKQDTRKYPRARNSSGKPLEIASAFSENVFQADCRAFTQWMKHIAERDREERTVTMIQIENEIGMLEDARDHSPLAEKAFRQPVPAALTAYLKEHKKELHPQMAAKWEGQGCPMQGGWQEVFGADIYTDEIFMAWHYARYVERLAQVARQIYDIPLYVNAAMNSRGRKPGEYPSAGPLAHLIDVWHCAAPTISLLAPDLYDSGFKQWVAQYHRHNNPLFIPEIRLTDNDGVRALYVFGEHDALGFSPFSIEDYSPSPHTPLAQSYAMLDKLRPLVTRYRGTGQMRGLLFSQEDKETVLQFDDLTLTCRHNFTLPWDPRATDGTEWPEGGGLVIRLNADEYLVAGSGLVITFATRSELAFATAGALGEDGFALKGKEGEQPEGVRTWKSSKQQRCGLGSVDEVTVQPDGSMDYVRRLNGDQTHQGRHVRISVGDWKILHVKLYRYE